MAGLWPRMQSKASKNVQGALLSPFVFLSFLYSPRSFLILLQHYVAVLSKPASFISLAILSICTIKSPLLSPINDCVALAEQK